MKKRNNESKYDYEALNVEIDDDEMIPITEQLKTPPPPPPPPAPEIIEVVEDEEEVVLSDVDLNDEKSIEDDEGKILEKAIKEYKEVKPKPINKTQTLTGKVNSPKESGGSKNIQRIE